MKTCPSNLSHRSHGSHRLIISHRNHGNHRKIIMPQNISKITKVLRTQFFQMMSCICFEVLLKASFECLETLHDSAKYKRVCFALAAWSFQDTSKKHNLYSERVQNKAVMRDCHLKEFYRFFSVNICGICVTFKNSRKMPCASGFQRIRGWEWWANMREFP